MGAPYQILSSSDSSDSRLGVNEGLDYSKRTGIRTPCAISTKTAAAKRATKCDEWSWYDNNASREAGPINEFAQKSSE